MPEINPTRFSIDSILELPADHFDAEIPDSTIFRTANPGSDRVTLQAGLLSGTGSQMLVTQLTQGIIDEYELIITPTNMQASIHGRDPMAFVLDYFYKMRYVRIPETTIIESVATAVTIPSVSGQFLASQIAKEAVAFAGLTLAWEVRDYILQETFDAVGRVIDILRRLIRPWTLVEPFKAEILMVNNVVVIRQRTWPITMVDLTLQLSDMKRERLTVRKRKTKKIAQLVLHGQKVAAALVDNPDISGIYNALIGTVSFSDSETSQIFADGRLISITTTTTNYMMPFRVMTSQLKETYTVGFGTVLSNRESIRNTWTFPSSDVSGQLGQPQQLSSHVTRERVDPSDPAQLFRLWDEESIGYSYDILGFQTGESRETKTLDLETGAFVVASLVVKTTRDKGTLLVEHITESYTAVQSISGVGSMLQLQSRDTQTQGGHRPGGPGRKIPVSQAGSGQPSIGGSLQLEVAVQLSTDPDAQDLEFSDGNLSLDDLNYLVTQFTAAQGLFEYEVQFDGVGMPWITRGLTLALTGIVAEDGVTPIPLPYLLITEVRSEYQETNQSRYTNAMRAFGYLST